MSLRKRMVLAREGVSEELSLIKGNELTPQEAMDSMSDTNDPKVEDLVEEDNHNNEFETELPDEDEDSSDKELSEEDVNTIAILKEEEEALTTEFDNYVLGLELNYNNELSLEENLSTINSVLETMGKRTIGISSTHIQNNRAEATELAKESLVDIGEAIKYYGKQFWLWLKKWCKKIWTYISKTYPFYKRIYKNILDKAVNIRKDLIIPEGVERAFVEQHRFIVSFLNRNPSFNLSDFVKYASGPYLKGKSNIYPVGEVDYKDFAVVMGHGSLIEKELHQNYKGYKTGVVGISQIGNNISYKVVISKSNSGFNNDNYNTTFISNTMNVEGPLSNDLELKLTPDNLILHLKAYINIIDGVIKIYESLSGISETLEMYDNMIKRGIGDQRKLSGVSQFASNDLIESNSKINQVIVTSYLRTFTQCDKLAQNFIKDYFRVMNDQLKEEAKIQ